jgi:hypothetical protein
MFISQSSVAEFAGDSMFVADVSDADATPGGGLVLTAPAIPAVPAPSPSTHEPALFRLVGTRSTALESPGHEF